VRADLHNAISIAAVPDPEAEANARLIAAAPELLDACKAAHGWLMAFAVDHPDIYDKMDQLGAAIARAESQ